MKAAEKIVKYFVHGLMFSSLLTILQFSGFLVILQILFIIGWAFFGILNGIIASRLWRIEVKSDWYSLILQGFFVDLAMAMIGFIFLVILAVTGIYSNPYAPIAVFVVQGIPIGFICKKITEYFEEEEEPKIEVPMTD